MELGLGEGTASRIQEPELEALTCGSCERGLVETCRREVRDHGFCCRAAVTGGQAQKHCEGRIFI